MKKKKIHASTILFLLMLLVGLGVLFYPNFCDLYYRWRAQQELSKYNQVTRAEKEDYAELWNQAEEYNRYLLTKDNQFFISEDERNWIEGLLNPMGTGMMGYVDIPKIDIHIPIYQGTEESELQAGAGYWLGSSLPTGGVDTHCILTAHNGLVRAKLFTDLDQLELGDIFSLTILDRVLEYEVDQILVVEPNDIQELYIVDGQDYVTLYTCTPYGVNTHRLLVRGHRILPETENGI